MINKKILATFTLVALILVGAQARPVKITVSGIFTADGSDENPSNGTKTYHFRCKPSTLTCFTVTYDDGKKAHNNETDGTEDLEPITGLELGTYTNQFPIMVETPTNIIQGDLLIFNAFNSIDPVDGSILRNYHLTISQ